LDSILSVQFPTPAETKNLRIVVFPRYRVLYFLPDRERIVVIDIVLNRESAGALASNVKFDLKVIWVDRVSVSAKNFADATGKATSNRKNLGRPVDKAASPYCDLMSSLRFRPQRVQCVG
jgi:hypothetical protein